MRCEGFDPENYGLYSLGSLDGADASAIDTHLAQDCETCIRELRRTVAFWSGFGTALSPEQGEARTRLWGRLPTAIRSRKSPNLFAWSQWGAAAALFVAVIGVALWFMSVRGAVDRRHAAAEMASLREQAQRLSRDRDQALASAQQHASAPQSAASQGTISAVPGRKDFAQLQQALSSARRELQQAQASLVSARSQTEKLQDELNRQQTELAAARSQQAQLSAQVTTGNTKQQEALGRVQALEAQVSQLKTERTRLLNVAHLRQVQSEQTLRTISFLSTPGTRLVELEGTEAAPGARGYALLTRDRRLMFYQAGLPSLPPGRTYQIWLIRDKGEPVVSGGLFTASPRTTAQSEYNEGALVAGLRAVAVTEEPAGGSKLPTGHKLLLGTLRS